ncbi:hypothetical protein HJC23_005748 [Cyclotella cryptica]|uniref:PH domain-containing protein n=1 Tax=Cyclotella cryptica TaxID=29204 RepID=A0ABD3QDJ1_9STRA
MTKLEMKVIPIDPPPSITNAQLPLLHHIQKVRITFQGMVQLCTDAELENARLKRLCLHRRRSHLPSHDNTMNEDSTAPMDIPFLEKYLVLDMTASFPHGPHTDNSMPLEQCTLSMFSRGEIISCSPAMIHAYNSRGEYERKCHSATKKQRLRVDRALDGEEMRVLFDDCVSGVRFELLNSDTDFCVSSTDGNKVLSTWYVRALSSDEKCDWIHALKAVTEQKVRDART